MPLRGSQSSKFSGDSSFHTLSLSLSHSLGTFAVVIEVDCWGRNDNKILKSCTLEILRILAYYVFIFNKKNLTLCTGIMCIKYWVIAFLYPYLIFLKISLGALECLKLKWRVKRWKKRAQKHKFLCKYLYYVKKDHVKVFGCTHIQTPIVLESFKKDWWDSAIPLYLFAFAFQVECSRVGCSRGGLKKSKTKHNFEGFFLLWFHILIY